MYTTCPVIFLVNRQEVGAQLPEHSADRAGILLADHSGIIGPVRTRWPGADVLNFAFVGSRLDSGINGGRHNIFLHPFDHVCEVITRETGIGLFIVGSAVSCARDKVETVPVVKLIVTLSEGKIRVHGFADGFVVVDRASGGHTAISLSVEVEQAASLGIEWCQVGKGGLKAVHVFGHSLDHPGLQVVVGDTIHAQLGDILPVEELGDPFTVGVGGGDSPGIGGAIVDSSVAKSSGGLEGEVDKVTV